MKIEATQNGTQVILKVSGRMDAANATLFQEECESGIKRGATVLILDFSELTYISSMGLRALVVVGKFLEERNGKLHICGLTGLVKQVFEITRLNSVFTIHDSVQSALAAV